MNLFKKTIIVLTILSFFCLNFPRICIPWQNPIYAKSETSESITKHTPEFIAPPEQKIPVESEITGLKAEKRKMNKWLWVGLGVLAAGVLAGAGGSGGGDSGDGGEDNDSSPPTSGDITIQWND